MASEFDERFEAKQRGEEQPETRREKQERDYPPGTFSNYLPHWFGYSRRAGSIRE